MPDRSAQHAAGVHEPVIGVRNAVAVVLRAVCVEGVASIEGKRGAVKGVCAGPEGHVDDAPARSPVRGVDAGRLDLELLYGIDRRRVLPAPGRGIRCAIDQKLVVAGAAALNRDVAGGVPGPRARETRASEGGLCELRARGELQQLVDLPAIERQLRHALVLHRLGERRLVRLDGAERRDNGYGFLQSPE